MDQKKIRFASRPITMLVATLSVVGSLVPLYGNAQAGRLPDLPEIRFTKVPSSGGGPDHLETIAGVVSGINVKECDCRIVLYSLSDQYWVQPFADNPYTELLPDNSFEADIHLGQSYYALLVKKSYRAPARLAQLPDVGGEVIVIASVKAKQN
jgi:hypothetical protein